MRKVLAVFALLLSGSGVVWADGIPIVQDVTAAKQPWTQTVYNNRSSAIQSGEVVVWDTSSTSFTNSGIPYVTVTSTADDIWTAGVTTAAGCAASSSCEIIVHGPALVRCMDATDAVTVNTTVGAAGTPGQCGDFGPAANKRSLGTAMQAGSGADYQYIWVFVDTLSPPVEQ